MHLDRQASSESAKRNVWHLLYSEAVRTLWDYVYRRFRREKTKNTSKPMGSKLPRLSDLISLDACRSKFMCHPAANQETPHFKTVQREFHTLRRIYRLLIRASAGKGQQKSSVSHCPIHNVRQHSENASETSIWREPTASDYEILHFFIMSPNLSISRSPHL